MRRLFLQELLKSLIISSEQKQAFFLRKYSPNTRLRFVATAIKIYQFPFGQLPSGQSTSATKQSA